jgi:alkanesulfonate monooxygenase SsuD/methylene tetrahydromethanopterin reductase-like flavin-dependent oxidoreductase (luciferase family)
VDESCRAVGRDPATVERTVTLLVRMPGGVGRDDDVDRRGRMSRALAGTPDEIADGLRAFAAVGVSHVQLVVDPITVGSIQALGPALAALDRG